MWEQKECRSWQPSLYISSPGLRINNNWSKHTPRSSCPDPLGRRHHSCQSTPFRVSKYIAIPHQPRFCQQPFFNHQRVSICIQYSTAVFGFTRICTRFLNLCTHGKDRLLSNEHSHFLEGKGAHSRSIMLRKNVLCNTSLPIHDQWCCAKMFCATQVCTKYNSIHVATWLHNFSWVLRAIVFVSHVLNMTSEAWH
jgi:hypothetical protein